MNMRGGWRNVAIPQRTELNKVAGAAGIDFI
jgi:hypothetical protein